MQMENVQILGFESTIDSVGETLDKIDGIRKDGEIIQLLNADSIASKNHIIHGVNQAFLAFERGENLAKDISVEIALRCSAQRQISKAFKILGLKEGRRLGVSSDSIYIGLAIILPSAIIGARLWYVIFNASDFNSFAEIIGFRNGEFIKKIK